MAISDGRLAALLVAGAFLIRLLACLQTTIFGTDGGQFLLMADWMGDGRFQDALLLTYHPLYPLLIAVLKPAMSGAESAGNAISVVLGAAATAPLFFTVRAVFDRPVAFVVALLYAFSPAVLEVQSEVMTEGTFMFFLFSSMLLTWKTMEEPSLERAGVLGASSAAAFLARPEGLLAVALAAAWPIVELVRRRDRIGARAGGAAITLVVLLLLVSPYLLWVKSVRGRWGLSVRPSAVSVEKVLGVTGEEQGTADKSRLYGIYLHSMFRMTAMGVLIPFHLVGLASLRGIGLRKALFYFSFPAGLLLGPLVALRSHDFMSGRYLLAGMTLLNALAALGMVRAMVALQRRRPAHPAIPAVFLLVVAVLPGMIAFRPRRAELSSARNAAAWIRSQGPVPRGVSGPVQQVAYLAGAPSVYSGATPEAIRDQIGRHEVDYYVYSEKDVAKRPEWIAMLRSCDLLAPPVEIDGPPGSVRMYVQRVR